MATLSEVKPAETKHEAVLSNDEILRYSRHLIMPEVGMEGQQKLKAARVLCIGAGGLGSPLALYLAAAGVGTLGIVDFDVVDYTNLQRQIIHTTADVGRKKLDSAADKLKAINPFLNLRTFDTKLTGANAMEIFKDFDIVADGTDNFPTRYLVNDACVLSGKPNVYGSIFRFEGQASVFATKQGPCYRCLYPEPPPPGLVPSCAEGGVLGILPAPAADAPLVNGIEQISVTTFKQQRDAGKDYFLLDVREPHEYKIAEIGGYLIPLGDLPKRGGELDRSREVVAHCKMGGRSQKAAEFLQQAGFKVKNLAGGIQAWSEQIDPRVPKY